MKKRRVIAVISVLLAVALLLVAIPSVAKYVTNKKNQSELTSQNFYFSSNFLYFGIKEVAIYLTAIKKN